VRSSFRTLDFGGHDYGVPVKQDNEAIPATTRLPPPCCILSSCICHVSRKTRRIRWSKLTALTRRLSRRSIAYFRLLHSARPEGGPITAACAVHRRRGNVATRLSRIYTSKYLASLKRLLLYKVKLSRWQISFPATVSLPRYRLASSCLHCPDTKINVTCLSTVELLLNHIVWRASHSPSASPS